MIDANGIESDGLQFTVYSKPVPGTEVVSTQERELKLCRVVGRLR